jgi:formate dehydrogenase
MVHPDDASAREIQEGDMVEIQSPSGSVVVKAKVSDRARPGLIVVDFGWGNPWDTPRTNVNSLVRGDVWDPVSWGTPNRIFYCSITK